MNYANNMNLGNNGMNNVNNMNSGNNGINYVNNMNYRMNIMGNNISFRKNNFRYNENNNIGNNRMNQMGNLNMVNNGVNQMGNFNMRYNGCNEMNNMINNGLNNMGNYAINNNNSCDNPVKIVQLNNMNKNNSYNFYNNYNQINKNMNNNLYNSFSKGINQNYNFGNTKITINLVSSKGTRTSISVPQNMTVQSFFKRYASQNGIDEKLLGKEIFFIYNACLMEINDQRELYKVFKNDSTITVKEL
jgi:hypothetical protein